MKQPNITFFVIGAARCGTTSLYRALEKHPKIFTSAVKEPRYFAGNRDKGWEWYRNLYKDAPDSAVCGDFSPNYTNASEANWIAPRIHCAYPDAKLIYLVRNPISCAISNWRMVSELLGEKIPFGECYDGPWSFSVYHRSCFFRQISAYRKLYSDDQILCVPLELIRKDPNEWMNRIYAHIGVDRVETFFPKANASDRKATRPAAPDITLAERNEFIKLVGPDAKQLLDYIGQPHSLWAMGPQAPVWGPMP